MALWRNMIAVEMWFIKVRLIWVRRAVNGLTRKQEKVAVAI
jgi:hypothetical protein